MLALPAAATAGDRLELREWGMRIAGGADPSTQIAYYALQPYLGLSLWEPAERWLAARDIDARWIIEPWVAFVSDRHGKKQTDSFEIGVSPLFARLTLGQAAWRPFVEGGESILYTDLRKQDLGTRVQFASQIGAGLEYQLDDDTAVAFAIRFRHMSNAGMARPNPGLNTLYALVGVTFR